MSKRLKVWILRQRLAYWEAMTDKWEDMGVESERHTASQRANDVAQELRRLEGKPMPVVPTSEVFPPTFSSIFEAMATQDKYSEILVDLIDIDNKVSA